MRLHDVPPQSMAEQDATIVVEVVWANRDEQELIELEVKAGSSAGDVILASGIGDRHPEVTSATLGIWGRVVDRDTAVAQGDRIEVYRPLSMDPREARRRLAESGRTMNQGENS